METRREIFRDSNLLYRTRAKLSKVVAIDQAMSDSTIQFMKQNFLACILAL